MTKNKQNRARNGKSVKVRKRHTGQSKQARRYSEEWGKTARWREEKDFPVAMQAAVEGFQIHICYDDDDEEESSIPLKDIIISGLPPCVEITPVLLTEEPVDSLIMGDENLSTIRETELDEVIKSSVENLVSILSESEGIPDKMCDLPLCDNPTPLEAFKEPLEI
ncbi:hypothetical protein Tco_0663045 [Tanacetum coccineum]